MYVYMCARARARMHMYVVQTYLFILLVHLFIFRNVNVYRPTAAVKFMIHLASTACITPAVSCRNKLL
jgi:hypothetical protein